MRVPRRLTCLYIRCNRSMFGKVPGFFSASSTSSLSYIHKAVMALLRFRRDLQGTAHKGRRKGVCNVARLGSALAVALGALSGHPEPAPLHCGLGLGLCHTDTMPVRLWVGLTIADTACWCGLSARRCFGSLARLELLGAGSARSLLHSLVL